MWVMGESYVALCAAGVGMGTVAFGCGRDGQETWGTGHTGDLT